MPSFIRIQDVADILIMSFLLYQLYSWFRRTRAMQVLLGMGVVAIIYFATSFLGLYMTSWILQELGTVLIVLIIVVFQAEIRQALYRLSLMRYFFGSRQEIQSNSFHQVSESLFRLAQHRTGAIVVFQRSEVLTDLMLHGVAIDSEFSPQLLEAVFADGTPLHDGALLINDGRIAMASCHLPLSVNAELPQFYGTRHRAALGLSERTDAVVAVVSEERGEVSLAVAGELKKIKSADELSDYLGELIGKSPEISSVGLRKKLFSNLLPKTAVFFMVILFWVLITSRQGQITNVAAPVRLHGISKDLTLVRCTPEEVNVQLKSFSILTPPPAKLDIFADIDITGINEGQATFRIKNSDFKLPSGMVVNVVNPAAVKVIVEKKVRKSVPVKVTLKGELPRGFYRRNIIISPATVEIEGVAEQVGKINSVNTEDVDAKRILKGIQYRKNLLPPNNKIVILRDEPVTFYLKGHKAHAR